MGDQAAVRQVSAAETIGRERAVRHHDVHRLQGPHVRVSSRRVRSDHERLQLGPIAHQDQERFQGAPARLHKQLSHLCHK